MKTTTKRVIVLALACLVILCMGCRCRDGCTKIGEGPTVPAGERLDP